MRISILSNSPWARTGYGNQTYLFAPRILKLGHPVSIIAFYGLEGGVLGYDNPWGNIPVYPKGHHPYGQDVMSAHALHFGADLLLSLIDAWVIDPAMLLGGMRWAAWYPVDHEPIPPAVRDKVASAYARIVYSRFGEQMTRDAGLDCYYVPHGVDCSVFKPGDRNEARERLHWPADKMIVGMVAANKGNPSRKAFCQNIAGFAGLKARHPDVMLYLHTVADESNAGVNLVEYVQSLGLSFGFVGRCDHSAVDVLFCDQYQNVLGYPDQYMVDAYNAMDVHLLVSMGEGFGLPILEAQACGCPVIVGDWTSMPEITFAGWKVAKADAEPYWTPLAAYQFIPHVGAIVDRLATAYRKVGDQYLRDKARAGALEYDADKVTEQYWRPVLADIESRIELWKGAAVPA
jgi:glycosyltransferase involved in cell wall biosynthesis